MDQHARDAYAVFLPVVSELSVSPWLRTLLERGTVAVLPGESREEYVARSMSPERLATETAADFTRFVTEVEEVTGTSVLVAVDQEPWGIQRLHGLVPPYPETGSLPRLSEDEIRASAKTVAAAAAGLGVNMFLAPVLDVLRGANPWLEGRTLALAPEEVGRIAAAVVAGVQDGGVVAVGKHFPGFPRLDLDPALEDTVLAADETGEGDLVPFRRVIEAGVGAIMLGPTVVEALDPSEPAATSKALVDLLRGSLAFSGLVISDDLDAPSTTHGRGLLDTVFASIEAGAELLLLPGGDEVVALAEAVASRSRDDHTFARTVARAAQHVRGIAEATGRPSTQ
ncbi:glycoside hydrolase family 3 N-terminal domain-containing protein [Streptomyces sp. NPDC057877]|uniref:glycoside hydrolase family 3 N-terminal domain-containing protein n=1 Tax=Streptomyces sp. NPDC057877 TaxID=3346269 RepID=UPI0036B89970